MQVWMKQDPAAAGVPGTEGFDTTPITHRDKSGSTLGATKSDVRRILSLQGNLLL